LHTNRAQLVRPCIASGGLSAFGAAQLVLGFGLESDLEFEVATLAAIAAFAFNFFLINRLSQNSFS
jgi:hypothetical protein